LHRLVLMLLLQSLLRWFIATDQIALFRSQRN
jgi:hypothetical protein